MNQAAVARIKLSQRHLNLSKAQLFVLVLEMFGLLIGSVDDLDSAPAECLCVDTLKLVRQSIQPADIDLDFHATCFRRMNCIE